MTTILAIESSCDETGIGIAGLSVLLAEELPAGVEPGYDGMRVQFPG